MAYSTIGFKDGSTPLDATNMNKMDNQIKANADDIDSLSTDLAYTTWTTEGGTELPANTDLDDITEYGNYYCNRNTTVETLNNCPTTLAFVMRVFCPVGTNTTGSSKYAVQLIITYRASMFIRAWCSTNTNPWYENGNWFEIGETLLSTTSLAELKAKEQEEMED